MDNKTLGAGADQAFATDSATAADDTFNPSDKVDGGAGDDTFYLTLSDTAAEADVEYTPSRLTNFETLSVTNIDESDTLDMNVSLMALSGIENAASSSPVTVTGATAGTTLTATGNTADTSLEVLGAGLTGADDTAVISLTGNSGAITYKSSTAQDIEKAAFTVTGINSGAITITDSGGNSAVKSATVSGSGSYDMTTAGGTFDDVLETLDASANTGGVTFIATVSTGAALTGGAGNDVLTGGDGNDVIKGGAGEDTLAMGSAGVDHIDGGAGNDVVTVTALTEDDSIVGGDGVDTLVIGAAIAYDDEATPTAIDDAVNISGFEVLRGTAALSQDMAALSGIVALQSTGGVLTATEASDIADFFAFGLTDVAGAGLDLTLATDGAADSLNIHVGLDAAQTKATSVTVDAVEIETALINSVGLDGNEVTDFEADALTSLSIIGNKTLSVTLNDSASQLAVPAVGTIPLTTVDASAFTGDSLTITAVEADSGVTVTTGSEALSVTVGDGANNITGTAGADTITTGKGNDTIVSLAGDDTIEAGDGVNTITATDGENDIDGGEGVDTITAGNGNNTIDGGDGADVIVAGTGNNTITNAAGNATITAGNGNNNVTNTAGNSTITLGNGTNVVNLTAGNSTVITGDGADDINITAGNNDITAGAGNDSISLGSGNDTVDAGTGTDAVDFSVARGTWTGAITGAETVTATYTGSATIDATGIAGYTTLNVTASDATATTTLKNIGDATVNLSDDSVEGGGDGDIEAMTIDTTDDATLTVNLGANQEAAIATAGTLASLAITDAATVTLKASGGSFGNLISSDMNTVTLDDDETTALTIESSDYTSLEATIAGSESLSTLAIDASGIESDVEVDSLADAVALTSLSLTAGGLNSTLDLGQVGDGEAPVNLAILDTISVAASNGSTIDFHTAADNEEGDINTQGDVVSLTVSADGAGSTVEAGGVFADGDNIETVKYTASNGGAIDNAGAEAGMTVNYGFDALTLATSGADSSIEVDLLQDEGGITASPEATITVEADGSGASIDLDESELGAIDLDTLTIDVGSLATLTMVEADIEVDDDIGTIDIDLADNATFEGILDIEAAGIANTLDINMGKEAEFAEAGDQFVVDIAGGSDAAIGIKTLTVVLEEEADAVVDTTSTNLITLGGATHVEVGDSESAADSAIDFFQGSVTITGDSEHTVNISNVLDDTALDVAEDEGDYGSWTVNTGEGNDTITGSAGADTITSNDGADSITAGGGNDVITSGDGDDTVLGGTGNDTLTVGNGADTVGGGAGVDSIVLTESVSSADVVEFTVDADGGEGDIGSASSDSTQVTEAGGAGKGNDTGQDTITAFTTGTDTIKITATNVLKFAHGTNTDLGTGTSTGGTGDDVTSFATNVGLINMNATEGTDEFGDAADVIINFASPTTTMTEALFEAALQYNITAVGESDITGGALADTITGGTGSDTIDGGAGADTITGDEGADNLTGGTGIDTFVFEATAAGNGADTITDFSGGAEGDILDVSAYLTTYADANLELTLEATSDTVIEDDHVYFVDVGDNAITSKAYDAGDFADIFDVADGYILTTTVDAEVIVIVQGNDMTKVYYVTNDAGGAIDADDVTLVGTLSTTTTAFHADNVG